MSASRTHPARAPRAALAGIGALAATALAAAAVPALAGGSAKPAQRHAGKTRRVPGSTRWRTASPTRRRSGKVLAQPPYAPATGDRLDITDRRLQGRPPDHAKRWAVSDHTQCVFGATPGDAPTCYGQAAMGGGQLLLFSTPAVPAGAARPS